MKKKYVYEHLITQMVDSQIFMYDVALAWSEIDGFLAHLKKYPDVYKKAIAYIENKQGNCQLILRKYKYHRGNKPIIIPGVYETINDDPILMLENSGNISVKQYVKKVVKCILPYGVVKKIRQRRNGGN